MLENIPIPKIRIIDFDKPWRIVRINKIDKSLIIAYCAKDRLCNDIHSGVFGVFDGHGGKHVADHIS